MDFNRIIEYLSATLNQFKQSVFELLEATGHKMTPEAK